MRWWGAKSFSCLTQLKVMLGLVELWLSWGFDNEDKEDGGKGSRVKWSSAECFHFLQEATMGVSHIGGKMVLLGQESFTLVLHRTSSGSQHGLEIIL